MEFPRYRGPSIHPTLPGYVPILPVSRPVEHEGKACSREMLPVNLAFAITIHKCQGATLELVVVDLGANDFSRA